MRSKLQIEGKVGQFYLDPIACRHLVLLLDDTAQAALPPAPAPAPAPVVPVGDAEDDIWRDRLTSMISRGSAGLRLAPMQLFTLKCCCGLKLSGCGLRSQSPSERSLEDFAEVSCVTSSRTEHGSCRAANQFTHCTILPGAGQGGCQDRICPLW